MSGPRKEAPPSTPASVCPCGRGARASFAPRFSPAEAARGAPWAARLSTCGACGLVVLDAPEAPLGGGYALGGPIDGLARRLRRRRARDLARLAPRAGARPRALDVGTGHGELVLELERLGLDAIGLEPSLERIAHAPRGARVVGGTLEDDDAAEPQAPGPFELVVFWHSLEHHRAPLKALARAAERLAPGGAIAVAVPNAGSWQARLAGARWLHLDLPHHRYHFQVETLAALARDAGLSIERATTGQWDMDLPGMVEALGIRLGLRARLTFDALRPNTPPAARIAGLAALLLLTPIALCACVAARAAGRAGTIRLVARKRG